MAVNLYCVTNRVNGKMYVGITTKSVQERWNTHNHQANYHAALKFHRAIRKYGRASFCVDLLYTYPTLELACAAEIDIINHLDLICSGYNSAPGGNISPMHSPEVRRKAAQARRGWKPTEDTIKRMSAAHLGKKRGPHSPETRAKISAAKRGRKQTPEQIEAAAAGKRGKKHSPERVAHRANAVRGRKRTPAQIEALSLAVRAAYARRRAGEGIAL